VNNMRILTLIGLLVLSFVSTSWAQTAKEIIKKADDKMQGQSNKSVMKMTVIRPDWKREVTMKGWSLGRDYSLILITAPARDKGSAFLKRKNEMWNWQPSIDRVVKLPPSMMLQSWMGSDFTNDDLVKQSSVVNDYNQTFEQDTVINGMSCYKINMIPNEEAAVVWGKVLVYIEKENYNQFLVKYYDEDDYLVNTMVLSNIKKMGYLQMEFDLDIKESFFSLQNMKRIR